MYLHNQAGSPLLVLELNLSAALTSGHFVKMGESSCKYTRYAQIIPGYSTVPRAPEWGGGRAPPPGCECPCS